ncbi:MULTISPECIES: helix-turn-helix domain-containing protein [unclassified Enterococcus]|uniref:helix-turn-helix domain-containing protein n=1 Tax=unclassified Enterococcus TaxID=2608891 RepID=UPI001CE0EFC4|nr:MULTISPECIES: helix-turn-helix domain-containing protein [unclassified Enterococcus]MCA5011434.1 helix-turn-helix domain-containing protein [Enterococcus sp. S23]MCA5015124.1 helix-turn-helix domain-containing protein [Enterococcus sp. S22(2020)]
MDFVLNFIDSYTQNKLLVLTTIKDSQKATTFEELAQSTGFEQRTIYKYVEAIFNDYKNAAIADLTFEISASKCVQVTYKSFKMYHKFIQYIIEKSFPIVLLRKLLLSEQLSVVQLSIEYYISDSTIKRRIQDINQHLSDYNLRIISRKGNLMIEGSERQIRFFSYSLIWNLYKGREWVFKTVKKEWAETFVDAVFEQSKIIRNLSNIEEIYYIVAINKIRQMRGHPVVFSEKWLQQLFSKKFLASEKPWLNEYQLTEHEGLFFLLLAQTNAKFYLIKDYKEPIYLFHRTEKTPLYQSIEAFFQKFSEQIETIDLTLKEELYKYVTSYHLFCMLFQNFPTGINNYSGGKLLLKKHRNLASKIDQLIEELYNETKIPLFKEKEFLSGRYALLFSMIGEVSKFEPLILIYIDTDLPLLAEKKIMQQLKCYIKESYNIKFINEGEQYAKDEADIVITTSYVDGFQEFTSRRNIIYIPENLRSEDVLRIRKRLKKILLEKNSI